MIRYICLTLILLGCSSSSQLFEMFKGQTILSFSTTIEVTASKISRDEEGFISHPYNTWQSILMAKTLDNQKICLLYKIPRGPKSQDGVLKLIKIASKGMCSFTSGKVIGELANVSAFKFNFYTKKKSKIDFELIHEDEKRFIELPLLNFPSTREGLTFKRYDNSSTRNYVPGAFVIPDNISLGKNKLIGKIDDTYKEGTAMACHLYKDDCTEQTQNRCHQCKFGHYNVVFSKCPGKYNKYCGIDHCGGEGSPACPRGNFYRSKLQETNCGGKFDSAFCGPELAPACDDKKNLICVQKMLKGIGP